MKTNKNLRIKIQDYLNKLDENEFPNICSLIKKEVMRERIIDNIITQMVNNPSLTKNEAISDIEMGFEIN